MRGKKVDDLQNGEASIGEAVEDLVGRVGWLRDEQVGRGHGVVVATGEELEGGAAGAVRNADSTGELDAMGESGDVVGNMNSRAYKSPNVTLCFRAKGRWASTISSTPMLASGAGLVMSSLYNLRRRRTEVGLDLGECHD